MSNFLDQMAREFQRSGMKPPPWLDKFATGVTAVLAWTPEASLAAMDGLRRVIRVGSFANRTWGTRRSHRS